MNIDWLRVSEISKNFTEAAAVVGAVGTLIKWATERQDRSTQVLLELENRFNEPLIRMGRLCLEDDEHYETISDKLWSAIPFDRHEPQAASHSPSNSLEGLRKRLYRKSDQPENHTTDPWTPIDELLRFYTLLGGIREAKQVKDAALRRCYRYWPTHYFNPKRKEFNLYVQHFFPSLKKWIDQDASSSDSRRFFRPKEFGWGKTGDVPLDLVLKALHGRILVITGSGISADSGIPTFRGKGGYWRKYDATKLATRRAFNNDPGLVWKWYLERRKAVKDATPNKAHKIVAELSSVCQDFLLVTQNVDNLHENAGTDLNRVVKIHGDLFANHCSNLVCRKPYMGDVSIDQIPKCTCGAYIRPGVVWFDEDPDPKMKEKVEHFLETGPCDLVIVIGTTAKEEYIVKWAAQASRRDGAMVEVNLETTPLSSMADYLIRDNAVRALPELFQSSLIEIGRDGGKG